MKMNEQNASIAGSVLVAIAEFESGVSLIHEVHAVLQSAVPRFENDGSGVADAVRLAEADLEELQFARPLDEQRLAAILLLEQLKDELEVRRRLDP